MYMMNISRFNTEQASVARFAMYPLRDRLVPGSINGTALERMELCCFLFYDASPQIKNNVFKPGVLSIGHRQTV